MKTQKELDAADAAREQAIKELDDAEAERNRIHALLAAAEDRVIAATHDWIEANSR